MRKILLFCFLLLTFLPSVSASETREMDSINQKVCNRLEEDVVRLAAIMEEVRDRKGIKETRVAFGGIDDQIKSADYWVTYASEAVAYQRVQKFLGKQQLRSSLEVLKNKILKAKTEVRKALE